MNCIFIDIECWIRFNRIWCKQLLSCINNLTTGKTGDALIICVWRYTVLKRQRLTTATSYDNENKSDAYNQKTVTRNWIFLGQRDKEILDLLYEMKPYTHCDAIHLTVRQLYFSVQIQDGWSVEFFYYFCFIITS